MYHEESKKSFFSGVVVGSATAAAVAQAAAAAAAAATGQSGVQQNPLELGQVQHATGGGAVPASTAVGNATNTITGGSNRSHGSGGGHQNNSGICQICNKSFRQLRSHIQDVHNPTATPCPLCGKVFQSKHKMFGHKYRSCPNRTRNLVRHLQDVELGGGSGPGAGGGGGGTTTTQSQPGQTGQQQVAVSGAQQQQQAPAHQPPPF